MSDLDDASSAASPRPSSRRARRSRPRTRSASPSDGDSESAAVIGSEEEEEEDEDEEEEDEEDEPMASKSLAELDEDPLETAVFQLVQDVVTTEWADVELTAKLNMIAEALEEAEAAFRKERTPPYRREGNLIGALLQVLEQHDEFYPMLESKLGELTDSRVKAAACRVLLATVSVNSRVIVRMLYEEETLDRMCDYAAEAEPPLRCYATGLLAVGLRDRSIADIVVNKEASITFLKRIRLYASKLERERQLATKYMQEKLKYATTTQRRRAASFSGRGSSNGTVVSTTGQSGTGTGAPLQSVQRTMAGLKRKFSETTMRSTSDSEGGNSMAEQSTQEEAEDVEGAPGQARAQSNRDEDDLIEGAASDILGFQPDPDHHEEDLKRLVMLELLYTLDCIGLMGEYMELFAPALKEDIIGTIVTFLHSKNPTVLSHAMKLTSHFLAHKKFCFSLIDAGGVELIFSTAKMLQGSGQISLLDRSLSMCLHGLASSNAVIEKALLMDSESLLSVSYSLLSSPNDRARQNAIVFFGLTLSFKVVLDYFEKENGLYTLLNIIRAGNNPKSAVQRQLSHDACLCLRQYLRVHMALVTHRLRRRLSQLNHPGNRSLSGTPLLTAGPALSRLPVRVPKLQASKPVDIDDKAHEQNLVFFEKYQFSVPTSQGAAGAPWSAASGPGGAMWPPAGKLNHLRGPLVMLEVVAMMVSLIQNGEPEENSNAIRVWIVERAQFCLECLRVLTLVVPSLSNEVCSTEVVVDENGNQKRSGLTILLEIVMSSNPRDSVLVRDSLYVFCNCVSPPHAEDCWQHPHKDIRQFTLTARDMRKQPSPQGAITDQQVVEEDTTLACCARVKDDKALRPVRKLARAKNAIKVCVQLLRYKRSVQHADAIRLLATRALLGLARDRHIAQILEKMQLGQLLSDLIRQDPVLEENADLHVRFRESALDLISIVTHRAPNAVVNEATDPTVKKIEKASIVAQTPITYDQNELLRLIHDHLMAKGLTDSAAALARESQLIESARVDPTLKTPEKLREKPAKATTFLSSQVDVTTASKVTTATNETDKLPDGPRPGKILKPTMSTVVPQVAALELLAHATHGPPNISSLPTKSIKLPHGERRKRVRQAFRSPHLFVSTQHPVFTKPSNEPSTTHKYGPHRSKSGLGGVDGTQSHSRRVESSRLDEIITHYLREQHRQCSNPVTTVPPFKLLGSDAFHRCPDPSTLVKTPVNICSRLVERGRTGFQMGARAFASPYADAGINRYVFSRYRPNRIVGNDSSEQWGPCVARFCGDIQREMVMGNHDGQVRLVQIDADQVVEEWTCHSTSSAVVDLEMNEQTRLGQMNRLMMSGTVALTTFGITEVAVWDVNSMDSARWRFVGGLSPRYNHYGDRVVALDARLGDEDEDMEGDRQVLGAVVIDLATGAALSELKDIVQSNDYGRDTNCCFAPDDSTILTGGMLWDSRIPTRALYKFDKLSNVGYGFFHPNGNEVIINSAVWDIRTYQLLRMVPALDKCTVRFNSTGTVMFAYSPHSLVDDMERRRPKAKSWFRVLDTRDYKDISTVELQRPIYDLAVDDRSTFLSAVEGRYLDADNSIEDDPVCRLYEIGRKRPSEDDSDVEDGQDGSDAMDDDEFDNESNTEEEEDDEDDEDDELDDEDDYDEYDEEDVDDEEYGGSTEGGEDGSDDEPDDESEDDHGHQVRGPSLSARDIHMLFEIPDGELYDIHDDYSSVEDGDEED